MKLVSSLRQTWKEDPLLRRVIRNTALLFSGNTIAMLLTGLQGLVTAALLGPSDYGLLGLITLFASNINRLLSFRMGEVVIKYAGQNLALGEKKQAAAVVKAAGLAEAVTSLVAYLVLALLTPLAARWIVKDPQTAPWILYYGLALLANLMTETSTAVLQIGNHYRTQTALNLVLSMLTLVLILVASLLHGGIYAVLTAYLLGKLVFGLGTMGMAAYHARAMLGEDWWKASLDLIPNRGEMVRFAISTNLGGTVNLLIRDSEVLWVGLFFSPLEAGYYKFALAVQNLLVTPVNPLITTTFPEISRFVAQRDWAQLRGLLRRTSFLAGLWTVSSAIGLIVLGPWGLRWFKGGAYLPSFPAILILFLGYGLANIFFWNRPLLLAFGQPNYPLLVNTLVGLAKTALMFVLVKPLGFLAQATLLSGYFLLSVWLITRRGLQELKGAAGRPPDQGPSQG